MGLLDGLLGSGGGAAILETVVTAMLSHQGATPSSGQPVPSPAGLTGGLGGLAGMLGGLMAGQAGQGGNASGLQGLISAFAQNGMGSIAQSWVGNGPNQPVSPEQVQTAFGDDKVQAIATHTGMDKQDVLTQLAQMLPGLVDKMTSGGHLPT